MSEFNVKVTKLSEDTYRLEVLEDNGPYIVVLLGLVGLGVVAHLMKEYDLTFEQALWTITGFVSLALLSAAGLIRWVRRRLSADGF